MKNSKVLIFLVLLIFGGLFVFVFKNEPLDNIYNQVPDGYKISESIDTNKIREVLLSKLHNERDSLTLYYFGRLNSNALFNDRSDIKSGIVWLSYKIEVYEKAKFFVVKAKNKGGNEIRDTVLLDSYGINSFKIFEDWRVKKLLDKNRKK